MKTFWQEYSQTHEDKKKKKLNTHATQTGTHPHTKLENNKG
jgi:hypothetical protein